MTGRSSVAADLLALFAAVAERHQTVSHGMSYGSPDTCLCGAKTLPEKGDEDVDVRRRRAVAQHQAAAHLVALTEVAATAVSGIQAQALRDAADRVDAVGPQYGYPAHTGWARLEAEWIERVAGLLPTPDGWCGNRDPHDPHPHTSTTLGPLACVGTEEEEDKQ